MREIWQYLGKERDALIFVIGLALVFAALIQLEIVGDYLRGATTCLIGLVMVLISALIRKFP